MLATVKGVLVVQDAYMHGSPRKIVAVIFWDHNTPAGYLISVGRLNRDGLYERGMKGFKYGFVGAEMTH